MNTNFHTLWGNDVAERDSERDIIYVEYRQKWHSCPENQFVTDFPLFLDLEATSYCNLKCSHCLHAQPDFCKMKMGYMLWEMYTSIIDEASANGCYGCKYHTIGRGEPLLNRHLPGMISYAKKKGLIDVALNTNATLLTEEKAKAILDAGLDRISFSVDGLHQTYERVRRGSSWPIIAENIMNFIELRDAGYKTKIRVQTVRLPEVDLDDFVIHCRWLFSGIDEIGVVDYKDMSVRRFAEGSWICPQPWQRMSVLWDGSILPCNHDDRQYARLGWFPEMSIKKAWRGSGMRMIRDMQTQNKGNLVAACNGCFLAQSEIRKCSR